jgi:hypothetical protein
MYRLNHQDGKISKLGTMLVVTHATRRHILDDGIFHSFRRENLKYYIALTGWAL